MNTSINDRFDQVHRELGNLREHMTKLEGSLNGLLTGRPDRHVA